MRHLSLFTGSGIGTLAAAECGIETVAQCENDPACCYALQKLWPDAHLFKDVHDVSATALRDFLPIDIISGGYRVSEIVFAIFNMGRAGFKLEDITFEAVKKAIDQTAGV